MLLFPLRAFVSGCAIVSIVGCLYTAAAGLSAQWEEEEIHMHQRGHVVSSQVTPSDPE